MSGARQEPAGRDEHDIEHDIEPELDAQLAQDLDAALPYGGLLRPAPPVVAAPLDLRTDTSPSGARVVTVVGEIDLATAPQLDNALAGLLAGPGPRVVLDLSGVTFLASRGIAVLLDAHLRAGERDVELHLVVTRPQVHRILEMTGLLTVLPCHSTRAAAVTV